MKNLFILCIASSFLFSCENSAPNFFLKKDYGKDSTSIISPSGSTIETRFKAPFGFKRIEYKDSSFASFLRKLPLKKSGENVKYFNGDSKYKDVYDAVINLPISKKDLHQCADAVMRLRAEYLFSFKRFDEISFDLTNGFKMDFDHWRKGSRVLVNGNKTSWNKSKNPSDSYETFSAYLEFVYTFAGTLSLSKQLKKKKGDDSMLQMNVGDVFILGASPGHAVIIVDMIENEKGEKRFMLAQSYMPAQETQILKNLNDLKNSPWYVLDDQSEIFTPEWTFTKNQLMEW